MPRIKRWFPVSHDINADPEVWAMRRTIGEKSLSIWLEILSIADRNDSELPGDYQELIRSVSGKCQSTVRLVCTVFEYAKTKLWLVYDPTLKVAKFSKYHMSRDANKIPLGNSIASPPSEPSFLTEPNQKDSSSIAAAPPSESASSKPSSPASEVRQKGPDDIADDPTWSGLSVVPLTTKPSHAEIPDHSAKSPSIPPCQVQWPEDLLRIRTVLVELEVLDAMADPKYWKAIDAWVESTGLDIFYLDELKGYVANQRSKAPYTKGWHKDLKSGFRNWLSQTKYWREKDAQRATIQQRSYRK